MSSTPEPQPATGEAHMGTSLQGCEQALEKSQCIRSPAILELLIPEMTAPTFYHAIMNGEISIKAVCNKVRLLSPEIRKEGLHDLLQIAEWSANKIVEWKEDIEVLLNDVAHNDGPVQPGDAGVELMLQELRVFINGIKIPRPRDRLKEAIQHVGWSDSESVKWVEATASSKRGKCKRGIMWWDAVADWSNCESTDSGEVATVGDMLIMATDLAKLRIERFIRGENRGPGNRKDPYVTVRDLANGMEKWKVGFPRCVLETSDSSLDGIDAVFDNNGLLKKDDGEPGGVKDWRSCPVFCLWTDRAKERARSLLAVTAKPDSPEAGTSALVLLKPGRRKLKKGAKSRPSPAVGGSQGNGKGKTKTARRGISTLLASNSMPLVGEGGESDVDNNEGMVDLSVTQGSELSEGSQPDPYSEDTTGSQPTSDVTDVGDESALGSPAVETYGGQDEGTESFTTGGVEDWSNIEAGGDADLVGSQDDDDTANEGQQGVPMCDQENPELAAHGTDSVELYQRVGIDNDHRLHYGTCGMLDNVGMSPHGHEAGIRSMSMPLASTTSDESPLTAITTIPITTTRGVDQLYDIPSTESDLTEPDSLSKANDHIASPASVNASDVELAEPETTPTSVPSLRPEQVNGGEDVFYDAESDGEMLVAVKSKLDSTAAEAALVKRELSTMAKSHSQEIMDLRDKLDMEQRRAAYIISRLRVALDSDITEAQLKDMLRAILAGSLAEPPHVPDFDIRVAGALESREGGANEEEINGPKRTGTSPEEAWQEPVQQRSPSPSPSPSPSRTITQPNVAVPKAQLKRVLSGTEFPNIKRQKMGTAESEQAASHIVEPTRMLVDFTDAHSISATTNGSVPFPEPLACVWSSFTKLPASENSAKMSRTDKEE